MIKSLKQYILENIFWVLPIAVFIVLLTLPVPGYIGLSVRYGLSTTLVMLFFLYYLTTHIKNKWGRTLGYTLILSFFALALNALWTSGVSETSISFGLIPTYDANDYYYGAQQFLEGHLLPTMPARRPLFTTMLASLLAISGRNLQIVLGILVLLNGLTCILFVDQVRALFGKIEAALVFVIIFMFYRIYAGTVLTENLGLALSLLGFTFLLKSSDTGNKREALGGVFLLTLAMMARSGALFILPFLVFWAARTFRDEKKISLSMLVMTCIVVVGGFLFNMFIFNISSDDDSVPFGNFSYTLYGITKGGEDWLAFRRDFPELGNLQEPELSETVYSHAFQEIKENPGLFAKGIVKGWQEFFEIPDCVFCFMSNRNLGYPDGRQIAGINIQPSTLIRLTLLIFSAAGLLGLLSEKNKSLSWLMLCSILGLLLSIPFIPPRDAGFRVYASIMPFIAFLPAYGVLTIRRWINQAEIETGFDGTMKVEGRPLSIGIVLLLFLGPLFLKWLPPVTPYEIQACEGDLASVVVRFDEGSYIKIITDGDSSTWLPSIQQTQFIRGNHNWNTTDATPFLDELPVNTIISSVSDLDSQEMYWVIIPNWEEKELPEVMNLCGELKNLDRRKFFVLNDISDMNAK